MIDKQRLIYDLALQAAAIQVQRDRKNLYLEAEMLKAFTESIAAYNCMNNSAFAEALKNSKRLRGKRCFVHRRAGLFPGSYP